MKTTTKLIISLAILVLGCLSVAAVPYTAAPDCTGMLAVIGPLRMNYPRMIASLECVADLVGESLSELLEL